MLQLIDYYYFSFIGILNKVGGGDLIFSNNSTLQVNLANFEAFATQD